MKYSKILKDGVINNNPILVQFIGMCSALAVTTSVKNALAMSAAVIFVLVCSNIIISLIKGITPDEIRIPIFIVVIATFVTIVQMFLQAFSKPIYDSLGIFLPLIVVNCIILGRAEAFAYKNSVFSSFVDGVGQGLGYTFALFVVSSIREIIGNGSFFGISLFGESFQPISIFIQPPGAFIILGLFVGVFNLIKSKKAVRE
ncbi:MAG: electron transport complex subunit E [Tissierellia bacterium]|nr:electron transport complex subunit E [Tissierellia bacterium]